MESHEKRDARIRREARIAALAVGGFLTILFGIPGWAYHLKADVPDAHDLTAQVFIMAICIIVLATIGTYRLSSLSQQMRDLRERFDKKAG